MDSLQDQLIALVRRSAKERGVVLSHIPDLAGISRSHFWDVLKGRKSPTLDWIQKVAASLELDAVLALETRGERPVKRKRAAE